MTKLNTIYPVVELTDKEVSVISDQLQSLWGRRKDLTDRARVYFTIFKLYQINKKMTISMINHIADVSYKKTAEYMIELRNIGLCKFHTDQIFSLRSWKRKRMSIIPRNFIKVMREEGIDLDTIEYDKKISLFDRIKKFFGSVQNSVSILNSQ